MLLEHGGDGLYQPLDLKIAKCRMMVAVPNGFDYESAVRRGARLRVATKYVKTAREHFAAKGVHVDLIKLYGSMELAPLVGLADAIVDLVSSGSTLKANNLVAVEEIMPISSRRLIVNQAALKLKREAIQPHDRCLRRGRGKERKHDRDHALVYPPTPISMRGWTRCSPSRRRQDESVEAHGGRHSAPTSRRAAMRRCSNTRAGSIA